MNNIITKDTKQDLKHDYSCHCLHLNKSLEIEAQEKKRKKPQQNQNNQKPAVNLSCEDGEAAASRSPPSAQPGWIVCAPRADGSAGRLSLMYSHKLPPQPCKVWMCFVLQNNKRPRKTLSFLDVNRKRDDNCSKDRAARPVYLLTSGKGLFCLFGINHFLIQLQRMPLYKHSCA